MNKINSFYVTVGDSMPGIAYTVNPNVRLATIDLTLHATFIITHGPEQYKVRLSDANGPLIPESNFPSGKYQPLGDNGLKGLELTLFVTFSDPAPYKRSTFTLDLLNDKNTVIESAQTSFFIVEANNEIQF